MSPLAEGRELKLCYERPAITDWESPLAEGRELKCFPSWRIENTHSVAPRGGA